MYLETMKKRFTEGELNHCEVMLRDIKESAKLAQLAAKAMVCSLELPTRLRQTLRLADACKRSSSVVILLARNQVRGSCRGTRLLLAGWVTSSNPLPCSFIIDRVSG